MGYGRNGVKFRNHKPETILLGNKERTAQTERYESIFNATSDSIIIYNDEGYIVEANASASKIFGYSYDELIGMHVSKLYLHPQDFIQLREKALRGEKYSGAHTRIRKDGSRVEVSYTGTRFLFDGKMHVLSASQDITIQKQTEAALLRAQEELRAKDRKTLEILEERVKERTAELEKTNYELLQFTSVASHDLKEPLRKISVYGAMLRDRVGSTLDQTSNRYLHSMINAASRMSNLIDDLLSFARLSQDNFTFERVDLSALLRQTLEDLELSINEKKAMFHIAQLPVIDGIALQLGQVFQNLISNSLKFAHPDRSPVISINCTSERIPGNTIFTITYTDNGIGFKQEFSEKIFEVFQRLHTRTEYEGTGVGLAIVKKIITLHNGQIAARGREAEGAQFEIRLPEKQP